MKLRTYKLTFVVVTFLLLAGCRPSAVVVHSRPLPPVYVRPMAPGHNYTWVDGEWIRRRRHYDYHKGYWAPPREYQQYRPGHWQQKRNGWYWVPGSWN